MRVNKNAIAANERIAEQWLTLVRSYDYLEAPRSRVEAIASQHLQGKRCKVIQRIHGAFNYCFRIRSEEEGEGEEDQQDQWILRFPIPGNIMNLLGKVDGEVAVMQFVREKTTIPIPKVIASGVGKEEFDGLGPYILMEYVDGLSLDDLILEDDEWTLRKDLPDEVMRTIYKQIANIYLELFQHGFSHIGNLSMTEGQDGAGRTWDVTSGPLSFKMNEIERMGGVCVEALDRPFDTTADYFRVLADQSMAHLLNNPLASRDEEDAHADYKSIHLLKQLAVHFGGTQSTASSDDPRERFMLFCDDFRIGNILVDKSYRIVAIIDWEFCYAAPAGFLCCPRAAGMAAWDRTV